MSLPETIDPGARYRIRITKPVKIGIANLLPRDTHEVSGSVLQALIAEHGPNVIHTADPV